MAILQLYRALWVALYPPKRQRKGQQVCAIQVAVLSLHGCRISGIVTLVQPPPAPPLRGHHFHDPAFPTAHDNDEASTQQSPSSAPEADSAGVGLCLPNPPVVCRRARRRRALLTTLEPLLFSRACQLALVACRPPFPQPAPRAMNHPSHHRLPGPS